MECATVKSFGFKGKPYIKKKFRYETMEAAQRSADSINNRKSTKIGKIAYQCKKCKGFHVGTGYKNLPKVSNEKVGIIKTPRAMKVVGKIDLSQYQTKQLPKAPPVVKKVKKKKERKIPTKGNIRLRQFYGEERGEIQDWGYVVLNATVRITTPDGRKRYPKFRTIFEERENNFYLLRKSIRHYINKNKDKL